MTGASPYNRPLPIYTGEQERLNRGCILEMLDNRFSIFRHLVEKSVWFRKLLNNPGAGITLFVFKDQSIPNGVRHILMNFEADDAMNLLKNHIVDVPLSNVYAKTLQTQSKIFLEVSASGSISFPNDENPQEVKILDEGNFFFNGVVYVVDKPIVIGI